MIYNVFGGTQVSDCSLLGAKETVQFQLLCIEPTYYQSL